MVMNNENEKIVSYGEAINLAISSKMDLDKSIYILGQGADDPTSAAGPLQGLKERFTDRIMVFLWPKNQ
jgi:pyruvate/2-oxoglutarate/acetoin dehydrogenase E1 component